MRAWPWTTLHWARLLEPGPLSFEVQVEGEEPLEGVRTIRTVSSDGNATFERRTVRRTRGIRINFRQTGVVGRWNWLRFWTFAFAGLSSVTVAWTCCETFLDLWPMLCRARGQCAPAWHAFLYSLDERSTQNEKQPQERRVPRSRSAAPKRD